jgi:SnoaL-like domain
MTGVDAEEAGARLELRTLVDTYATALDDRDFERWTSLFMRDGEFIGFASHDESAPPTVDFRGHQELRGGIAQVLDAYERTFHFVGNHICEVTHDTAVGETYCLAHHLRQQDGTSVDHLMLLRYTDKYVHTPGGWRFASRRAHQQWSEVRAV